MKKQTLSVQVNRIHKLINSGLLRGFADVTINDVIVIKGLRIIDSKKGLFVSMPQTQSKDNRWFDNVYPTTKEARALIQQEVLTHYEQQ